MKNDFDFIKEKFDADNISAPDSIDENNIIDKLSSKPKLKLHQKTTFKAIVGAIACFALAVGIFAYAAPVYQKVPTPTVDLQNDDVVASFESYSDIKQTINRINEKERYKDIQMQFPESFSDEIQTGGWVASGDNTIKDAASTEIGSTDSTSFAKTYIQVEGVDEADIIKNDGKYIYYVNNKSEIKIYQGEELITTISDFNQENTDKYICIDDIYIKADELVVNVTAEAYYDEKSVVTTDSYIYDLSDISNPRQTKKFTQSGSYTTSRLIGNTLYVISNKFMYDCKTEEDCYITTGENGNETTLPADSIKCGESINDTNCLVVSAVNLDSLERAADTKAFFGCSSSVYCNKNNMYITISGEETEIVKAELTESEIKFTATAKVKGYVHNQFSMDERNGCFRIATSDEIGNNLYIFDSQLNKISEITGFAENEQIQAMKYIGDMAYVITYEQIDPLFVIDLSDPHNPEIKGSVEITGFSSQLVSVDENTLLGIGYDDQSGIKLVLFDISNPLSPAVLDSYIIFNAYSNAQYNHKAIVVNKEKNYFAIDYSQYTSESESGGIVFEIKDNKIHILNRHIIHPTNYDEAERVTYIDDTLYVLDSGGDIYSFNQE